MAVENAAPQAGGDLKGEAAAGSAEPAQPEQPEQNAAGADGNPANGSEPVATAADRNHVLARQAERFFAIIKHRVLWDKVPRVAIDMAVECAVMGDPVLRIQDTDNLMQRKVDRVYSFAKFLLELNISATDLYSMTDAAMMGADMPALNLPESNPRA